MSALASVPATARPLARPRPVRVRAAANGVPQTVEGQPVEAVRESWLVEDRWWTERPLRRRYWEVVSAAGRNLVVFRDLSGGGWFEQRDHGRSESVRAGQSARPQR